jgi:hypothetical protein
MSANVHKEEASGTEFEENDCLWITVLELEPVREVDLSFKIQAWGQRKGSMGTQT